MTPKDESPRWDSVQYATGDEQRTIANSSRKREAAGPKRKLCSVVYVSGEGNGNPLQCSCLENPRDRGAWWIAIYGVAQSRTRLKQLSSSSSSMLMFILTISCLTMSNFP